MPRQLQIEDGPGVRQFVYENGIVSTTRWGTTLTMDLDAHPRCQTQHHRDPRKYQMTLKMLGSARKRPEEKETDLDEFCFIGRHYGGYDLPKVQGDPHIHYGWVFLGRYNTRTRKGMCIELTDDEVRDSAEGQKVFMDFMRALL